MRIATPRSIALALTFALSVLVHQASADASCMGPQGNWSLGEGASLPAEATLFYFSPSWNKDQLAPKVVAGKLNLKSTWQEVSTNDAFTTYRLRFNAGNAEQVTVETSGESHTYAIEAWKAPREKNVTGTIGKREQSSWTCSHTDNRPATVTSQAHAFRISWFDQRNGIIDWGHGSSIFPRSSGAFWSYNKEASSPAADFLLGHPNCFAYNIPSENLDTISVTVTPLFRDGSKGKPVTLKRGEFAPETSEETETEAPVVDDIEAPAPEAVEAVTDADQSEGPRRVCKLGAPESSPSAKIKTRLFAIALLLGTLFGFLVFRGHRQGVSTLRLIATGAVVSIACGTLAWAATLVVFPFWLLFVAAGVFVLLAAARFLKLDE
jgi:hypothetical protein